MGSELSDLGSAAHALDAAFNWHTNTGDVDGLVAACYADDAVVLLPNLPIVRGCGQIRELFRELSEAGVGDVVRETTFLHAAGDLGYGIGSQTTTLRPSGSEASPVIGKYLLIYRRQADGIWKIVADMFNSDLPTATAHQRQ
jgi:ketosteroid isomerase-like protein